MKLIELIESYKIKGEEAICRLLDRVFNFNNRSRSSVKKLRQGFDEKTGEHVIILEYRVRLSNHNPITKKH